MKNGDTFPVVLTFESDWLIGTGRNQPAGLDELTARDPDGLPYVPGSTAVGMVRDGAENVAYAFDGGGSGTWNDWVHALFGGQAQGGRPPRGGCLDTRPLRLPDAVRNRLRAAPGAPQNDPNSILRRALVITRAGVALDPRTRTALPNMLRFGERARAGMSLYADWTLTVPDLDDGAELPWEAELLLLAGMRLVDHVGAHRRRGAGRCGLAVGSRDDHRRRLSGLVGRYGADGDLSAARSPASMLTSAHEVRAAAPVDETATADAVIDLRIELLSPIVATDTTIGNDVRSLPFVPGTTLLPLVQRAFGRLGPLLQSGGLVVTDATPEIAGRRSVPTPLALQAGKRQAVRAGTDLTVVTRTDAPEGSRPVPVGGFCVAVDDGVAIGRPTLTTQPHAVVDDDDQRPTQRSGGLFTYQSIAAGTVLRAEIRFLGRRPENLEAAMGVLTGRHSLGRSRKDEYGAVEVTATVVPPPARPAAPVSDEFVVWLVSDLILPENPSRTPAEQLADALSERLGVILHPVRPVPGEPPPAVIRMFRRESWHARWQLPRPSLNGLAGGSVIRLAVRPDATRPVEAVDLAEQIARVEVTGIGARTAEGFGQLRIDAPLLGPPMVQLVASTPAAPASSTSTGDLPEWWVEVERSAWRSEITQRAVDAAMRTEVRRAVLGGTGGLTWSQLGVLRLVASGPASGFGERLRTWDKRIPTIRRPDWRGVRHDKLLDHSWVITGALQLPKDRVPTALSEFAAQQLLLALLRTAKGRAQDQPDTEPDQERQ